MNHYICRTCGTQYEYLTHAPMECRICTEERQYVSPNGQSWTTLEEMRQGNYQNEINLEEKGLYSIKTTPTFGIGQTAYLIQNDDFNLLWDCLTYIDEATIKKINALGGIDAIALSHPHYYSSQVEWAKAFNAPIYIHQDDQQWVMHPSEKMTFWSGESLGLSNGLTLHRLGGHFKGGAVVEWKNGNEKKGILLTGDIIQVVADRRWVSFMYSYPNLIPLPETNVKTIATKVATFEFDRLYNAFHRVIKADAKTAVQNSATRYIKAINGSLFNT